MATEVNVYSKVVGLMSQVLSGVQANIWIRTNGME